MPLSISRFRAQLPFETVLRMLAAIAALVACIWYTMAGNPEIQFGRFALDTKLKWARHLDGVPKYVIFGGSSCAFGIQTGRLGNEHQIPAVNMGTNAGFGVELITRLAVEVAEPGDTLVMSMEPDLVAGPLRHPAIAVQFAYANRRPDFLQGFGTRTKRDPVREVLALRPMGLQTFAMLGKAIARRPLFRYQSSDVHPDGFVTTNARGFHAATLGLLLPTDEFLDFLTTVRDASKARNIETVYCTPWMCVLPEDYAAWRRYQARALARIAGVVPVLRDESLGVITDASLFSDTPLHLTAESAAKRTDQLADLLKHRRFWTAQELDLIAQGE